MTWHNSGMVYTARDFTGPYDGEAHGITVTVTTPADATIKYRTDPSDEYTETAPTRTDVGTTTVYFQITRDGWTTVEDSKVITVTKPVYRTKSEGGNTIAVDPMEMRKLLGTDVEVSAWESKFQAVNAAGVGRWEAYVLGIDGEDAWQSLTKTMIIEQGAESTPAREEPTFKMPDAEKLSGATQRLEGESSGLPGVKEVKCELVGKTPSGEYATVSVGELIEVEGTKNPRPTPLFIYDLSKMPGDVKFFMIRRVYDFINQAE